jgi:sugar phosphate isomerase/epimerase
MRLGATIDSYGQFDDPADYIAECLHEGYRSAPCPKVEISDGPKIQVIRDCFAGADIVIGEVQAWVNPMDPRPEVRRRNRRRVAEALAIADEVNAVCCATVVGSLDTDDEVGHVAPHPDNFSQSTFEEVIAWLRQLLDEVNPRRACLTLEISPWTFLDGVDSYRRVLDAVNHPRMAVHLDPANTICSTRLYFSTTAVINRLFDELGPWIVSCHAKDILQDHRPNQVTIHEVLPGKGVLDYRTYIRRIRDLSPDMPVIIEHLPSKQDYREAAAFIRDVGKELGEKI